MKKTFNNMKRVYQYGKEYKKHLIFMVFACISGIVIGLIVPLLAAKQIVYLTSSVWEQAIYISLIILVLECYTAFGKMFFWSRNTHRFIKGTTKNLQIKIRTRNFEN